MTRILRSSESRIFADLADDADFSSGRAASFIVDFNIIGYLLSSESGFIG